MVREQTRPHPPLLRSSNQWARLAEKIKEAGGCKWCLISTYEFDTFEANRWAEETGLANGLVLTRKATAGRQGPHAFRWIEGVPIHAKVLLVQGPNGLVIQIGSGNLTAAGLRGRGYRDVVWTEYVDLTSPDIGIVKDLAEWFLEILETGGLERKVPDFQIWPERLRKILSKVKARKRSGSGLWHNFRRPIMQEFKGTIGRVKSAWVMTPYLHPAAIKELSPKAKVVIPANEKERKIQGKKKQFLEVRKQVFTRKEDGDEVFTHAKVYLLKGNRPYLAWGSANCTVAGLGKLGGSRVGPRTANHEVLAWKEITKKEFTRFRKRFEQGIRQVATDVETTEETEPEELPDEPELLAWGRGNVLEVVLAAGNPPAGPIRLICNGGTVEKISSNPKNGWSQKLRPKCKGWEQAAANGAEEWEAAWGKSGPVKVVFLAEGEPEKDLAYLWGGKRGEEAVPAAAPDSRKSNSDVFQPGNFTARLDDYENKTRKVANNLLRDLGSFGQDLEPIFERLWKERPELGTRLLSQALEGGRLFLCARLLAVLEQKGADPKAYVNLRSALGQEIQTLCQKLPRPERSAFLKKGRGWRDIHAWTSPGKKVK